MKTAKEIIKEHVIKEIMDEEGVSKDFAERISKKMELDEEMIKSVSLMMKAYAEQAIDECAEEIEYCRYFIDYDKYLSFKQYILNVKNLLK
jgi:hypothetical protein